MKIKEQTRKRAAGCSKHRFEVVDRTDEGSSKYYFEVADGSWRGLKRFSKSINKSIPQSSLLGDFWISYFIVHSLGLAILFLDTEPNVGEQK